MELVLASIIGSAAHRFLNNRILLLKWINMDFEAKKNDICGI
jgi:hypothetical protein